MVMEDVKYIKVTREERSKDYLQGHTSKQGTARYKWTSGSSKLGQQVGKRQAATSTDRDSMVGAMLCSHSWKGNSANNN